VNRTVASLYFFVQGIAVVLWWAALLHVPGAKDWFVPPGALSHEFRSLVMPDLAVLAAGSLAVSWMIRAHHRRAGTVALLILGAVLYATVYTVSWALHVDAPALSVALMALSLVGTTIAARAVV
jgi:hypothetical protein